MSSAEPPDQPAACATRGRRRAAAKRLNARSSRPRARDTCPERPRLLDPDHEAFVDWFVAYWRSRGAQLFANDTTRTEA
jgi:hypothetical protein